MRHTAFHLAVPAAALALALATTPACAEPGTRVFGSATAAVMGGIVGGPIGLVAGAAIGYFLGPALTGSVVTTRQRVARRRVVRQRVAAAPQQEQPAPVAQAYAPMGYAAQGYYPQQMPVIQQAQVPAPQQPYRVAQVPTTSPVQAPMPQQAMPAFPPAYAATMAQRPAVYAPVPMPYTQAPSGNYAAQAYRPQDGGLVNDPLH